MAQLRGKLIEHQTLNLILARSGNLFTIHAQQCYMSKVYCYCDYHMLIYNLLKASFIALNAHIELAGLRLPKISGQDINFQSDLIPTHIFHRSLMLNFKYEVNVSDFFYKRIIKSFKVTGITYENDTP